MGIGLTILEMALIFGKWADICWRLLSGVKNSFSMWEMT